MRAREEQVEEMVGTVSDLANNGLCADYDEIECWVKQAEQRGYERARAECAADTQRLEWLEKQPFTMLQLFDQGWTVATDQIERSFGQDTARNAIDAAMEGVK